jgi:hypothetical protein
VVLLVLVLVFVFVLVVLLLALVLVLLVLVLVLLVLVLLVLVLVLLVLLVLLLLLLLLLVGPGGLRPRNYRSLAGLLYKPCFGSSHLRRQGPPTPTTTRETPSRARGNCVRDTTSNFAENGDLRFR